MKFLQHLLFFTLSFFVITALAGGPDKAPPKPPLSFFVFDASVGPSFMHDPDHLTGTNEIPGVTAAASLPIDASTYTGYNLGLMFGYQIYALRFAVQYLFFSNRIKHYFANDVDESLRYGHWKAHAVMMNVLFYFSKLFTILTPYAGIGLGYARVNYDILADFSGSRSTNFFAYQVIVGVSMMVSRRLGLFVDYRYLGTAGDVRVSLPQTPGLFLMQWRQHYHVSTLNAGVELRFAA